MFQARSISIHVDSKISDVLSENPYLLLVFEHMGLSAPFHDRTIAGLCEEHSLSTDLFLTLINLYNGTSYSPEKEFSFEDTVSLVSYLKNSHAYYLEEIYPNILEIIKKMTLVNTNKEMALVQNFFIDYFSEVKEHLDYEDDVVFPYVTTLYKQIKEGRKKDGSYQYSVSEFKKKHTDIEEKLYDLKNLLIKYLPSKNDREIRRELLITLFELEIDLNIHTKIEDLILIPLVSKMETYLKKIK